MADASILASLIDSVAADGMIPRATSPNLERFESSVKPPMNGVKMAPKDTRDDPSALPETGDLRPRSTNILETSSDGYNSDSHSLYEWDYESDPDCPLERSLASARLQFPNPWYERDGPEIQHVRALIFPHISSPRSYRNAIELAVLDDAIAQALAETKQFDDYLVGLIRQFRELDEQAEFHVPFHGEAPRCIMLLFLAGLLGNKERGKAGAKKGSKKAVEKM